MNGITKITTDTAAAALTIFAGRTITLDELNSFVTQQYKLARKRTGITSYFKIFDAVEAQGVTARYTGPDYTGECLYTFPPTNLDAGPVK